MVRIIAWCQIGNKPLPETMMTQFIDTYMGLLIVLWIEFLQKHGCFLYTLTMELCMLLRFTLKEGLNILQLIK